MAFSPQFEADEVLKYDVTIESEARPGFTPGPTARNKDRGSEVVRLKALIHVT